jgi:hypothetical protein
MIKIQLRMNDERVRKYPKAGRVTRCVVILWVNHLDNHRRTLVGVVIQVRCMKMIAVKITDGLREVVVQGANSRVKRSPKTLSPTYTEQDVQQRSRFRRPTLVGTVRTVQAMGMQNAEE